MNENPYKAPQAADQSGGRHDAPIVPVSPKVRAVGTTALLLFVVFPLLTLAILAIRRFLL
jgi:hypothetical protein